MDDDSYRAMLTSLKYPTSTADLTIPQMERVLERLKQCGFKVRSKRATAAKTKAGTQQRTRAMAHDPQDRKIRALWLLLHEIGAIQNPSEQALSAYVHRITKVDALQWLSAAQADRVIETLKKWAMRYLPTQVDDKSRRLIAAIKAGDIQITGHDLIRLGKLINLAKRRQTFDLMQAAWDGLHRILQSGSNED